jgi:hypothetical protein
MESLINENLGLMADVFSIISQNLNIVDKVQVGLVNKGLNEIMKPIIKKDNVQVFYCRCFYRENGKLCKKADRRIYCREIEENSDCMNKSKEIEIADKKEKIENIVIFGCLSYMNGCKVGYLENKLIINNDYERFDIDLPCSNNRILLKNSDEIKYGYAYNNETDDDTDDEEYKENKNNFTIKREIINMLWCDDYDDIGSSESDNEY